MTGNDLEGIIEKNEDNDKIVKKERNISKFFLSTTLSLNISLLIPDNKKIIPIPKQIPKAIGLNNNNEKLKPINNDEIFCKIVMNQMREVY